MEPIPREYIFDENNRKIAVQIDIQTFEKIEVILEDYALEQLIIKNEKGQAFDLFEAESFYKTLEKAK
ncbi:hypothetical protein KJ966_23700 [bacterium]|nr:hypothetical protein [bacterium]